MMMITENSYDDRIV